MRDTFAINVYMKTLGLAIFLSVFPASCAVPVGRAVKTSSGLEYEILKKGVGKEARSGDEVHIYETTSYRNGTVLYSNENTSRPVKIKIGAEQATTAVDEGLRGMRTGEIRVLNAPARLVKRKHYPPNVSPDSALVIKITLDKIL